MSLDITTIDVGQTLTAGPYAAFKVADADFVQIAGARSIDRRAIVDGTPQIIEERLIEMSDGTRVIVLPGDIVLLDATPLAEGLGPEETRPVSLEWQDSDGNTRAISINVGSARLVQSGVSDIDTEGQRDTDVIGTFHQTAAVDVIRELFDAVDDAVPVDLDSLLDFTVIDVDTTITVSYDPTTGLAFSVVDNRETDGLISNIGETLEPIVDKVNDVSGSLFDSIPIPVSYGPTFEISTGLQASLGWDIDLPTLGKTSISQPVSLHLFTPDQAVAQGDSFAIGSDYLLSYDPTVTTQTIGIGNIALDLGFSISELKLSGLGFAIGTKDFLGLPLEGLAKAEVELNADIDIEELLSELISATGFPENPDGTVLPSIELNLSFDKILAGLVASETDVPKVIADAIKAVKDKDPAAIISSLGDLRDLLIEATEIASGDALPQYELGGARVDSVELVELAERAAFGNFDARLADGTGVFQFDVDGETVNVTASQVEVAMSITGTTDVIASMAQLLGEEGYSPFDGLTLQAALPFGNIEQIYGWGDGDSGQQVGTHKIVVEQATTLAGVSVDFEKLMPEITNFAIDLASTAGINAAKAQPYLIPVIAGAALAGKTLNNLQGEYTNFLEAGQSIDVEIEPSLLVAEMLNPILATFNTAMSTLSPLIGGNAPQVELLNEDAPQDQVEDALFALRDVFGDVLNSQTKVLTDAVNTIQPLVSTLDTALDVTDEFLRQVSSTVISVRNALQGALDGIGIALGGIQGAINALLSAVGLPTIDLTSAVNQVRDIFGAIDAVEEGLRGPLNGVQNLLNELFDGVRSLPQEINDLVTAGINEVTGVLIDFSRGFELGLSTEFDLFEFIVDAGIDVVQIATFNPDDVTVSYTLDGVDTQQLTLGQQAEFFANGAVGDILEGEAVYSFSGEVDYDYRLRLNIDPTLHLYNTDVSGAISVGGTPTQEFNFDYSLLEATSDFSLDSFNEILGGNAQELLNVFDDALIEIPLELFDNIAQVAIDSIRDNIGVIGDFNADLDWNELRLFSLDGVEISQDQFTQITQAFDVQIGDGGAQGNPMQGEWVWANQDGFYDFGIQIEGATLSSFNGTAFRLGEITSLDTGGELVVQADGRVLFDPDGDFSTLAQDVFEEVRFDYEQADGTKGVGIFRVRGANDAPIARDDQTKVAVNATQLIDVLSNDTDIDTNDVLTLTAVEADQNGTVAIVDGKISYTPEVDFVGTETLTYTVTDALGATDTATVSVNVSLDTPADFRDWVWEDQVEHYTFEKGLLFGLPEGTRIIAVNGQADAVGQTVIADDKGSLRIDADGAIHFTPLSDFTDLLPDQFRLVPFEYTLDDGQTYTGNIEVRGYRTAPEAADDTVKLAFGQTGQFDVRANDTDADANDVLTIVEVTAGDYGTAEITDDGLIAFAPRTGFVGHAELSYRIRDSYGEEDTATLNVLVGAPARTDEYVWSRWGEGVVTRIFADDSGEGVKVASVNGSAAAVGEWITTSQGINVQVRADGTVSTNTDGLDWISFGEQIRSDIYVEIEGLGTQLIVLAVRGEHADPEANNDYVRTRLNEAIEIDVLSNDYEAQSADTLSIVSASAGEFGNASVENGHILFDPTDGFEGLAKITYQIIDNSGRTDEAVAYVEVGYARIRRLGDLSEDAGTVSLGNLGSALNLSGPVTSVNGQGVGQQVLDNGATLTLSATGELSFDPAGAYDALSQGEKAIVYLDIVSGDRSYTASFEVRGVNDAPELATEEEGGFAGRPITLGVLERDLDRDATDGLRIVHVFANAAGSIAHDGSVITFTPDADFTGIAQVRYLVADENDAIRSGTSYFKVFENPDAQSANQQSALSSGPTAEYVTDTITGTFQQRGGVDVGEALVSRLADATGFDLNDLLDFSLIDVDAVITARQSVRDGFSINVEHAYAPSGVLGTTFAQLGDTLETFGDLVGDTGVVDLGLVEISPEITAKLGLDMNFGWDIDLVTLGKTAFSQPVAIDLERPVEAIIGEYFTVMSSALRVLSPHTVTETIGLGSTQVFAGLDFFGTEIGEFGWGVASSSAGDIDLDGLFAASVKSNYSLSLETVEAFAEQFMKDVADAISTAANLPVSASNLLDTIFAIDLGDLVQGLFSDTVDWTLLIAALDEEELTDKFKGIIEFLAHLSEAGSSEVATHNLGEISLSSREIYDLSQDALFGEHDGLDAAGNPAFKFEGEDGEDIWVSAQTIHDARDFLGIDANVDSFVQALNSIGYAPLDSAALKVELPIGNVEEIEGFGGDLDNRDTDTRDELGRISVTQTSRLLDIDIDFEALQRDIITEAFSSIFASGYPPGLLELSVLSAAGQELTEVFEEGVTGRVTLKPAELIVTLANGFIDVMTVPMRALNELFDDIDLSVPQKLTVDQLSGDINTAIDQVASVIKEALGGIDLIINEFKKLIEPFSSGGSLDVAQNLGYWANFFFDTVEEISLSPFYHVARVLQDFNIFGFRPQGDLGFTLAHALDDIQKVFHGGEEVNYQGGVRGFVNAGIELAEGTDTLIRAILDFDPRAIINTAVDGMAQALKDAAGDYSLEISTKTNLLEATLKGGVDLVQTAHFNPDEIEAIYSFAEQEVRAGIGEAVQFKADGNVGDTVQGEVEYVFSGDVGYDYRLAIDIAPILKFFESTLTASLSVGSQTFDFTETYALLSTDVETSPLYGDGVASQFDEALIEINFDLVNLILETVRDQVTDLLGLETAPGVELQPNQVLLFTLDDIPLDQERFSSITSTFEVDLVERLIGATETNTAPTVQNVSMLYDASGNAAQTSVELPISDVDGDDLSVRLLSGDELGTIVVTDEHLFFTPRFGLTGDHAVTLAVSDGRDVSTMTVTLTQNTAPQITSDLTLNAGTQRELNGSLRTVDPDGQQLVHFDASSLDPDFGRMVIYADGRYQLTLTDQAEGTATVNVGVSDGITETIQQITITAESIINDELVGTSAGDVIRGTDLDETLDGGDGHDIHVGGTGNDVLLGNAGSDRYFGGAGYDIARLSLGTAAVLQGWSFGSGQDGFSLINGDDTDYFATDIERIELTDGILQLREDSGQSKSWRNVAELYETGGSLLGLWSRLDNGREMIREYEQGSLVREGLVDTLDTANWQYVDKAWDGNGRLTHFEMLRDNGVLVTAAFDNGNMTRRVERDNEDNLDWSEITRLFAEDGFEFKETVNFDDGRQKILDKNADGSFTETLQDETNLRDWSSVVKTVDADGDVVKETTTMDSGIVIAKTFADETLTRRLETDVKDIKEWHSIDRTYTADGALASETLTKDNLWTTARTFENGEVIREVITRADSNAPWTRVEKTLEDGILMDEFIYHSDGRTTSKTYGEAGLTSRTEVDEDDVYSWSRKESQFGDDGVLDEYRLFRDDGTGQTQTYDEDGNVVSATEWTWST